MLWEVPSVHSVADGLLMTGDTVAASPTAEDTGMCNASVARFVASELLQTPSRRRSEKLPFRVLR